MVSKIRRTVVESDPGDAGECRVGIIGGRLPDGIRARDAAIGAGVHHRRNDELQAADLVGERAVAVEVLHEAVGQLLLGRRDVLFHHVLELAGAGVLEDLLA